MTTTYTHPLARIAPQRAFKEDCPEAFAAMAKASVLSEMLSGVTAMEAGVGTREEARLYFAEMRYMIDDLADLLDGVIHN